MAATGEQPCFAVRRSLLTQVGNEAKQAIRWGHAIHIGFFKDIIAYLKVRQGGRIVSVAAIIAVAANTDARREIIGPGLGPSEAGTFRMDVLPRLKARGLGGT